MIKRILLFFIIPILVGIFSLGSTPQELPSPVNKIQHVILISIDGLRSDAIRELTPQGAPTFHYIINHGATTLNARTDPDNTVTLPNHTSMLTGLGVNGKDGHNYVYNDAGEQTIHDVKGRYVPSVFDVVHDNGLRTALFSAKDKFRLYAVSYGANGIYYEKSYFYQGKQKIDAYKLSSYHDEALVDVFLEELTKNLPSFVFLHLSGTDNVGHHFHWDVSPGSIYLKEVQRIDTIIGRILKVIQSNEQLSASTAVIITSDHGGHGNDHQDIQDPLDFTIPFMVWGPGVAQGFELYGINPQTRKNPRQEQIPYGVEGQPIRNGDAANLALSLLGLPAIPGSIINLKQDLNVFPPQSHMVKYEK